MQKLELETKRREWIKGTENPPHCTVCKYVIQPSKSEILAQHPSRWRSRKACSECNDLLHRRHHWLRGPDAPVCYWCTQLVEPTRRELAYNEYKKWLRKFYCSHECRIKYGKPTRDKKRKESKCHFCSLPLKPSQASYCDEICEELHTNRLNPPKREVVRRDVARDGEVLDHFYNAPIEDPSI